MIQSKSQIVNAIAATEELVFPILDAISSSAPYHGQNDPIFSICPDFTRPNPPQLIHHHCKTITQVSQNTTEAKMSLTKENVRAVLTADWLYRKKCSWPLIEISPYDTLGGPRAKRNYSRRTQQDRSIFTDFKLLQPFMAKHRGKLAVCGGAVTNSLLESTTGVNLHQDADIFFYGISQDEATAILEDCVATLVSSAKKYQTMRVEHRQHVTNVVVRYTYDPETDGDYIGDRHRVYQFIHRLYPTLDSILGGFDIPLSMFAFAYLPHASHLSDTEGPVIVGTPLAVFCAKHNVIIVDTTRRSFSYEHRILKYRNRYDATVFFPGLDPDAIKQHFNAFETDKRMGKKLNVIEYLMQRLGLKFNQPVKTIVTEIDDSQETCRDLSDSDENEDYDPEKYDGSIYFTTMQISNGGIDNLYRAHHPLQDYDEKWLPQIVCRYSDYSDCRIDDAHLVSATGCMLRCNNFAGIFVSVSYPPSKVATTHATALRDFKLLVADPKIIYDVEEYMGKFSIEHLYDRLFRQQTARWQISCFAEHFYCLRQYCWNDDSKARLTAIRDELVQRMHNNAIVAKELLTGIKWITENPGRQWTSSFNPIMEDPREFYGGHYIPFTIGIPVEIESLLRLFRLRETVWRLLPRDVFKLLLQYVVMNYAKVVVEKREPYPPVWS